MVKLPTKVKIAIKAYFDIKKAQDQSFKSSEQKQKYLYAIRDSLSGTGIKHFTIVPGMIWLTWEGGIVTEHSAKNWWTCKKAL